jgi:hypothetical protein
MATDERANDGGATTLLGTGAVAGAAAYALGYLLTFVWQSGGVDERLRAFNFVAELLGGDVIPTWKGVAWLFYNAHFVSTNVPALAGSRTVNFISSGEFPALLYVVPPLFLGVAGLAAARYVAAADPGDGARAGATVAVGYLPLAVGVALASTYSVGENSLAPELLTAVLLAGVVYPLAFGALGGVLATALD